MWESILNQSLKDTFKITNTITSRSTMAMRVGKQLMTPLLYMNSPNLTVEKAFHQACNLKEHVKTHIVRKPSVVYVGKHLLRLVLLRNT